MQNNKRNVTLGKKFKLRHNETILFSQYQKQKRNSHELPMNGWAGCELRPQTVNAKNMTGG